MKKSTLYKKYNIQFSKRKFLSLLQYENNTGGNEPSKLERPLDNDNHEEVLTQSMLQEMPTYQSLSSSNLVIAPCENHWPVGLLANNVEELCFP